MPESLSQSQEQNLPESPDAPVLLPSPLQYLSHCLQILAVKIHSEEHVVGLERAVVHDQSESEHHISCVE